MLIFELDSNFSEGIMTVNGSRYHLNDEYASKVWPSILFLSVIMLTGSFGNLLVCVVYRFDLSKVNNRFILALTGIDLINCLTSIPGELADLRYKYSFGDSPYCPAMRFFQAFCSLGSAGILVAISVDRFQKICNPFGKQTTLRTSGAAIFVCGILSLLCASPAAAINGRRSGLVNGVSTADCSIADAILGKSYPQIYNGFFFFLFICACFILVVMYSLIWKRLRKQKTYRLKVAHGPESTTQVEKYHRTDITLNHENLAPIQEGVVYREDQIQVIDEKKKPHIMTRLAPFGKMTKSSLAASNVVQDQDDICNSNSVIEHGIGHSINMKGNSLTSNGDGTLISVKSNCGAIIGDNDSDVPSGDTRGKNLSTSGKPSDSPSNVKPTSTRSVEKTTAMMLMVTAVFILSFLPYVCLTTAQAIDRKRFQNLTNVQLAFYNLFLRSHFLNSALNPFIYSFFNAQFRGQLWTCYQRIRKCRWYWASS